VTKPTLNPDRKTTGATIGYNLHNTICDYHEGNLPVAIMEFYHQQTRHKAKSTCHQTQIKMII